jgi:hypothetical protein
LQDAPAPAPAVFPPSPPPSTPWLAIPPAVGLYPQDKPPIGTWVSIDDRPLLQENGGDELRGHFVRTKLAVGITDRIADRMVAVLNGDASQADGGAGPVRARTCALHPCRNTLDARAAVVGVHRVARMRASARAHTRARAHVQRRR